MAFFAVSQEANAWLDATVYEVFTLPVVPLNQSIIQFNLMLVHGSMNSSGYFDFDDILFDLQSSNPFFYLANQSTIDATILTQNETILSDKVESIQLFAAIDDGIPLNDYEMTIEVTAGGIPLLSSDIIVHVVERLPTLSAPGNHLRLLVAVCA